MTKLLSATALAAMLALGGAAWAQQAQPGQPGQGTPGSATGAERPSIQGGGMASQATPTTGVMSEQQIRDKLAAAGYANAENIVRDGNSYRATAMRNDRRVEVTIDAHSGAVRSEAAAR
jgi:hypothetical protein